MIISITLDQQVGGIAQSLINYSKALKKINKTHLVILPDKAVIIKDLEDISNVKLVKIPKILLKFHLITKFVFDKNLENLLSSSKFIFIHNYKLVKYLSNFRNKIGLINHSGKARKPHNNIYNIFLTSAAKERFLTKYPLSRTKNIIIPHGFSNIRQRKKIIDRNDNFLNVVAAGRFVEKKGFEDLIEVANILSDLKLDTATITTGLLHDTIEDTHATYETIKKEFGQEVADLVDGVTKISVFENQATSTSKAENFRKLILATSKDIRVLLVKIADRLHNMRTIDAIYKV